MNNLDFLKKYYNLDYFKPEYLSEEGLPKYLQQPNNEDVDWVEYLKDNKQGILGNLSKSATAFALGNNTSDAVRNIGYTGLNFIPGYGQILSTVLPVTDKLGEGMEKAIANGYKGGIGSTLSNIQSYIPGSKSNLALTAGVAGLERMFGSKINDENVNKIKNNITNTNDWNTNATTYDSLAYDVTNSPMVNSISQNQVGKDGSGFFGIGKPKRAKNLYNRLSTQVDLANDRLNNKIFDARAGVANNVNLNMNKNYYNNFALGGNLFENGGDLFNYGLDFSNGLQYVNAGSTHENNPYQGVPISINEQDGQPNLVEEGEVIAGGDYVFSNRLTVPDDLARRLGVPRGKTYAEAVKYLSKESEELPNDPIVKRGLRDTIAKLQESQEQLKQEQQEQEQAMQAILSGQYADGGTINIKEANKGLFTKAAKKVGMGTQEYAHHILANKDDYSTQQIRRANFARNAAGWQHANGGHVFAMGSPEVSTDWDSTILLNLTGIDTRDEKTKMLERLDKTIKETQTKLNRQGNVKEVNFSLPKSTTTPTIRLNDAVNSMMNYDTTPVGFKSQDQRDREYGEMMNIDLPTETTHGDEEYLRNGLFAIENAARVGMKNGKITPYDKSTLGAGLDFEKNTYGKEIKNILNKRGYLTQEEHDKFLTSNISDFEKSIKSDLNKIGIRYTSLPKEVKLALLQRAWQTGSASESIKLNKDALQSKDYDTVIRYMTEGNGMKDKAEAINRGGRLSDYLHNNGYVSDAEYADRQNAFAYANRPKTNEEIVSELGRNFILGLDNSPEALQAATDPNYADKINEFYDTTKIFLDQNGNPVYADDGTPYRIRKSNSELNPNLTLNRISTALNWLQNPFGNAVYALTGNETAANIATAATNFVGKTPRLYKRAPNGTFKAKKIEKRFQSTKGSDGKYKIGGVEYETASEARNAFVKHNVDKINEYNSLNKKNIKQKQTDLQENISTIENKNIELQDKVDFINQNQGTINKKINTLKKNIDNINKDIETLKTKKENYKRQDYKDKVDKEISKLEKKRDNYNKQLEQHNKTLGENNIEDLNNQIKENQKQINEYETQLNYIKKDTKGYIRNQRSNILEENPYVEYDQSKWNNLPGHLNNKKKKIALTALGLGGLTGFIASVGGPKNFAYNIIGKEAPKPKETQKQKEERIKTEKEQQVINNFKNKLITNGFKSNPNDENVFVKTINGIVYRGDAITGEVVGIDPKTGNVIEKANLINEYKVLNDYEKNLNDNTNNTTTPTQKTTPRSTQQTQPTNEDETIIDWEVAYDNNEFALGGHMYDGNSETSQYIPVSQLGDWQRTDVANFDWKNASSLPEGFDWDWRRGLLNRFNNWQPYTHTEKWNKTGYDGIYPKGSDEEKTLRADPRYNFFNGYDDNLTRYGKMYNLYNKNNKKIKQIDFSQPLDKQIEYIKHLRYDDSVGSGSQEIGLRQNRYYTQDQNGNRRYVNVPDPTLYNVAEKYTDSTIDPNNPSVAYYNYLIKDIPQNNIIQDNTATTTTPTQQQQEETPKVKRKYLPYLDDSLRYVPLGINAASLLYNTRPVDFTAADRYRNYAEQMGTPISSPLATIGNYRRRNPYDESYTANMINQTTAANNRQSYDIAGGNRAMQMGSQSARDYANLQQLSQNALAAYQANRTDDAQVADFNRATDETNVKYENARNQYLSQLNNARDLQSKQALINEVIYRQGLRNQRDIAIANDISRLSENLSGLGKETRYENILRWLYNNGVLAPTHDILTKTERTARRKDRKKSTEKRKVKQNKKTKLEDVLNMSYPLVDITPEILKYK